MIHRIHSVLLASSLLLTVTACPSDDEPIVGAWVGSDSIGGVENELEIDTDLSGTATIYFVYDDELYYADFDVEIVDVEGKKYELEFQCDGDCSELDFTMDCEIAKSGDELECDGDGIFRNYDFQWERN